MTAVSPASWETLEELGLGPTLTDPQHRRKGPGGSWEWLSGVWDPASRRAGGWAQADPGGRPTSPIMPFHTPCTLFPCLPLVTRYRS